MLLGGVTAPASAATLQYDGRATDPESGMLLYIERHLLRERKGKPLARLVTYLCPDGAPFARKIVDYGPSAIAPSFSLTDGRDGYREGMRRANAKVETYVRRAVGGAERTVAMEDDVRIVADAGFDEYVRRHWQALSQGNSLPIEFVVPASLRTYSFTLRKIASTRIRGVPAYTFRLKLGGLLGLVAPKIDISYARDSRRLLRFEGITNLRDDRGRQWSARIDFDDRAARPVEKSLWKRAASAPLRRCATAR